MTKRSWIKITVLLSLVGCAAQWPATGGERPVGDLPKQGWDGTIVTLSPEATKELAAAFGGQAPKAFVGLNDAGKLVVYQPSGSKLARAKFPVPVGDLWEPPQSLTLVTTTQSPPVTRFCIPLAGGGIWCF